MTTKRPDNSAPAPKTIKMVDDKGGFTHGFKPSENAPTRPATKPPAPPAGSGGGSKSS